MAELRPYPFAALVTRMFRELEQHDAIYDLPRRKFFLGNHDRDLSVYFHGKVASCPLGPAAGPQSQMAQNLVLSWLGGCRIMELKTVQIMDELDIPRPCIDMQTVGYNVEWSQELKLEQSLAEYVKGAMLIRMLERSDVIDVAPGFDSVIYDMSVGYDLKGIKTDRVQAFITGMQSCGELVDQYRREIPDEFAHLRDLDYDTHLSDTLTLSTFHGCPPDEIEKIIDYLLEHNRLNCVIKLNPMLLGPTRARQLLHDQMGYDDVRIPDTAFERDAKWPQVVEFTERLKTKADELGLGLGVKFTNTLIVENHREFFPESEKEMYLSGPPLHVLAMNLVGQWRDHFGDRLPISFSAGIDQKNFADAVAIGLVPVTVCSDLLKPGGYGRAAKYCETLGKRMAKVGADNIGDFMIKAYGLGTDALEGIVDGPAREACERALADGTSLAAACEGDTYTRWLKAAKLLNTRHYVAAATEDSRYALAKNSKPPRKLGSHLELFDCVSCNKCVPVCPNDANFVFALPAIELPIVKATCVAGQWTTTSDDQLTITKDSQYANFADFCNECGNCDVFCPEDGGPYVVKPRFFGSLADWRELSHLDGFFLERGRAGDIVHARIAGAELKAILNDNACRYSGTGFDVELDLADASSPPTGSADDGVEVDLSYAHIIKWIRDAVVSADAGDNYLRYLLS